VKERTVLKFTRSEIIRRFLCHFEALYGEDAEACLQRLRMIFGRYGIGDEPILPTSGWSERDVFLITYADMIRREGEPHLQVLKRFCDQRLDGVVNTVHILPFFPYSSDDGFSVIDYRRVDEPHGDWDDVNALSERFGLMFDLVLNHCSSENAWFRDFLNGIAPGRDYFIEMDPETDLSTVVRPRSSPLLTKVQSRNGEHHLWTTFSADQIDLDFSNPDVLFEFLDILLYYIYQGARVIRLDAIAYLWKRPGTSCIHLPEVHEVVKLFREVLDLVAPHVQLLTETNVPHKENIAYFGDGDEATMVYQFSLPPLLLHALINGDAQYLTRWAAELDAPPEGCTYLNFTASHDGVGVRPLEGLVPDQERQAIADRVVELGGRVSTKRDADGNESPYELNISYFDALADGPGDVTETHIARFLASQTVAMELQGVPAVYFHSLTATRNWAEGLKATGQARTINRRKWDEEEVELLLEDNSSATHKVFDEYTRRLRLRRKQPAFHPAATQQVLDAGSELFTVVRESSDPAQRILCLTNMTGEERTVPLDERFGPVEGPLVDLLSTEKTPPAVHAGGTLELTPYQTLWLTPQEPDRTGKAGDSAESTRE
jgi:sucrose phosphorylase